MGTRRERGRFAPTGDGGVMEGYGKHKGRGRLVGEATTPWVSSETREDRIEITVAWVEELGEMSSTRGRGAGWQAQGHRAM